MRYTHNLRIIRRRKYGLKISLFITLILALLILFLGFTELDAKQFFIGFVESFWRVIIAYGISLFVGIALALLVTSSRFLEDLSVPVLDALQSFPSFALYPLFVLWLGKTSAVTIFILVIEMIWPILFTIFSSSKQMRGDLLDAARVYGATGLKYYVYVLPPLLFPSLITGSIVAWGEAWEAIIAAEIIVRVPGVGTYLAEAGTMNNSQVLIVGIFLLLALLFLLNKYLWLPLLNMSTKYQSE